MPGEVTTNLQLTEPVAGATQGWSSILNVAGGCGP
jgi:hypothetical protein